MTVLWVSFLVDIALVYVTRNLSHQNPLKFTSRWTRFNPKTKYTLFHTYWKEGLYRPCHFKTLLCIIFKKCNIKTFIKHRWIYCSQFEKQILSETACVKLLIEICRLQLFVVEQIRLFNTFISHLVPNGIKNRVILDLNKYRKLIFDEKSKISIVLQILSSRRSEYLMKQDMALST